MIDDNAQPIDFPPPKKPGEIEFRILRRAAANDEDEIIIVFDEADFPELAARATQRGQTVANHVASAMLPPLRETGLNIRLENIFVAVELADGTVTDELPKPN